MNFKNRLKRFGLLDCVGVGLGLSHLVSNISSSSLSAWVALLASYRHHGFHTAIATARTTEPIQKRQHLEEDLRAM